MEMVVRIVIQDENVNERNYIVIECRLEVALK